MSGSERWVLYLAVLPSYRAACVDALLELAPDLRMFASAAHLDKSVKTGISANLFTETRMLRLGSVAFVQFGGWRHALRASDLLVDLNPRSLTAWMLILARRVVGRRTLVWGHLHPRSGAMGKTARVRRMMRSLADGVVLYTATEARRAEAEVPGQPVWSAPNALYRERNIGPGATRVERDSIIYVGRFEAEKKVALLVRAAALAMADRPQMRLVLVGAGTERDSLARLATTLGIEPRTEFVGWCDDLEKLRALYARSFASASPGFAGLGLTQSAGMGVPMVVARDEPHSPEIEIASVGGVKWCGSDDPRDMARVLGEFWSSRETCPDMTLVKWIRSTYSAESMARGIVGALSGAPDDRA